MRHLVRISAALLGALLFVAVGYFMFGLGRETRVVRRGEPIRQDDFLYTVVGVARSKSIGAGEAHVAARGIFYVATVEVTNEAIRVPYRWDPSITFVVDSAGRHYALDLDAQRVLDATSPHDDLVPAGASARFEVVFDLPKRVDRPALAFSNGILMGDVFDRGAYMKARVPLD